VYGGEGKRGCFTFRIKGDQDYDSGGKEKSPRKKKKVGYVREKGSQQTALNLRGHLFGNMRLDATFRRARGRRGMYSERREGRRRSLDCLIEQNFLGSFPMPVEKGAIRRGETLLSSKENAKIPTKKKVPTFCTTTEGDGESKVSLTAAFLILTALANGQSYAQKGETP